MTIDSLYDQAKHGDSDAELRLFNELSVRLSLFAYRYVGNQEDAKDAVQEAMIQIIAGFRDKSIESSFSAWSYAVLKHVIWSRARKRRRRRGLLARHVEEIDLQEFRPDPDLEIRLARCLRQLVQSHPRYARVLNLKYQGYTTEQICKRLGITRDNLYVLHSRAQAQLKACLDRGESDR